MVKKRGPQPAAERLAREREQSERFARFGSKGGKRSLETMTPEARAERAKKAVAARNAKSIAKSAPRKGDFKTVDEYIAALPKAAQDVLNQVRRAILGAVPEAEETISYNMPTYKLGGERLLYFAAWKQHYSIYAATDRVIAAFRSELAPYRVDKGTIRFLFSGRVAASGPVTAALIGRIAKFRANELSGRSQKESAAHRAKRTAK